MTGNSYTDTEVLTALRAGWGRWDPPPDDLAETILVALAMDDLDADFELLTLVSRSDQLAGARSNTTDRVLIEFRSGELTVLVRVTREEVGNLRLDGWVTPAVRGTVTVVQDDVAHSAPLDTNGRFTLPVPRHGLTRLVVEPIPLYPFRAPTSEFRTTLFEI